MKYKFCPQCGFRQAYKNIVDIYAIADSYVYWSCPQCREIELMTLTEFISRSTQSNSTKSKIEKFKGSGRKQNS